MRKIFRKKNIKYYLVFYLIIDMITGFSVIKGVISFVYNLFEIVVEAPSFEAFIKAFIMLVTMFLVWFLSFIVMTLPVTIALLANKTVDVVQERQNRRYSEKDNIVYYREKFKGIALTTISIMQNLRIEEEKDITAILMKLQLNNNILVNENSVKIVSDDVRNLLPEEQQIFYMISESGRISKNRIESWKNSSLQYAISKGYIKQQNSSKGLLMKKIILIAMMLLLFLGFTNTNFSQLTEQLDSELNNPNLDENITIVEFVGDEENNKLLNITVQIMGGVICLVGMIAWPVFYIVFVIKYQNKNNSLKRTEKGEKLASEIQGMKNFIHDFSLLNEVSKDNLALWDDFLIYAIVLEENEKIVEEVLNSKGINYFDTKLIIEKISI